MAYCIGALLSACAYISIGRERAYERVAPNNEVWLQLNTRRAWPPVDKNTTHRVYFN